MPHNIAETFRQTLRCSALPTQLRDAPKKASLALYTPPSALRWSQGGAPSLSYAPSFAIAGTTHTQLIS